MANKNNFVRLFAKEMIANENFRQKNFTHTEDTNIFLHY